MLLPILVRMTEEPYEERPLIKKTMTMAMDTLKIWKSPGEDTNREMKNLLISWIRSATKEPVLGMGTASFCDASRDPNTTAVMFCIRNTDTAVAAAVQPMRTKASM